MLPTGEQFTELAGNSTLDVEQIQELAAGGISQVVEGIPQGEAFDWLVTMTGQAPEQLTQTLYQTHNIQMVWYIMGVVGLISALGIYLYGKWILVSARKKTA
jgi:hypothetical protein